MDKHQLNVLNQSIIVRMSIDIAVDNIAYCLLEHFAILQYVETSGKQLLQF